MHKLLHWVSNGCIKNFPSWQIYFPVGLPLLIELSIWSCRRSLDLARPASIPSPLGSARPFQEDNEMHCPSPSIKDLRFSAAESVIRPSSASAPLGIASAALPPGTPCLGLIYVKTGVIRTWPSQFNWGQCHRAILAAGLPVWSAKSWQLTLTIYPTLLPPPFPRRASQALRLISILNVNSISESTGIANLQYILRFSRTWNKLKNASKVSFLFLEFTLWNYSQSGHRSRSCFVQRK